MYELTIKKHFAAAHRLINYDGDCSRIHGHTWMVEVAVSGEKLDQCGMLIDFKVLKGMLEKVIKELDHSFLNELAPFCDENACNPTAENLARYIYEGMSAALSEVLETVKICGVRVWESPDASAYYSKHDD